VAPDPAVAVLYTIMEVTGEVTGEAVDVELNATRGINSPLLVEVISSLAAGLLVPMPTF
jgi:hypothetical protein